MVLIVFIQFGYAKEKPTYYGIVIGCCSKYQNEGLTALHAKDDAKSFYNKLMDMYYSGSKSRAKDKLYLLTEKQATRTNIKNTLKKVTKKAKSGDVVYFFFSGHGSSLDDPSEIITPAYNNNELIKVMENSGLIVPYDFNINKVLQTAIIGKRDLKNNDGYGFKRLDNHGIQVIMISDSCYAGNIFRNSSNSTVKVTPRAKLKLNFDEEMAKLRQNRNKPKRKSEYKNLIFFSAGGTDKAVSEDNRLKRGKFSLEVEKCLKSANQNGDDKITKKEFEDCLRTEDNAKSFVRYPVNRHANKTVFKSITRPITVAQKDKIRVKTSIRGLENMSSEIVIDNKNYDIEIVKSGNMYQIFRYTGEEYCEVNKTNLKTYLNSLKLFKLKGTSKLNIKVIETDKRKERGRYCKGEMVEAQIKSKNIGKYIVALTLNREGEVIMLQPNDQNKFSLTLIRAVVQYPFGMDKIKVFALTNQKQYNKVKKLVIKGGLLTDYGVNQLYTILKNDKSYKEAEIDIETLDKPKNYCRKGD